MADGAPRPLQAASHRDEPLQQLLLSLQSGCRPYEASPQIARQRSRGEAVFCYRIDRHAGSAERADHADAAVVQRIASYLDNQNGHRAVERWPRTANRFCLLKTVASCDTWSCAAGLPISLFHRSMERRMERAAELAEWFVLPTVAPELPRTLASKWSLWVIGVT